MVSTEQWEVKNKARLLLSMMEALAGNARISLEGDLRGFPLAQIEGAASEETEGLKRSTLWPAQDFVTVPLEPTTIKTVLAAIGGNVPRRIVHIKIEKNGTVEFAAYDNFQPGCIVFGPAVGPSLLRSLMAEDVLSRPAVSNR